MGGELQRGLGLSGARPFARRRPRTGRRAAVVTAVVMGGAVGCQPPPSVQAVDSWLTAYAAGDVDGMVEHTVSKDRALVRQAMAETSITSSLALVLPPRPMSHELMEIESKAPDRHVVLTKVTTKNPLPFMSERVGQDLNIPKTRTRFRRFLSVRGSQGPWQVQLDLPQVLERTRFVRRFQNAVARGAFEEAKKMLEAIPRPPDEANAQSKKDRLEQTLTAALQAARDRRSTELDASSASP